MLGGLPIETGVDDESDWALLDDDDVGVDEDEVVWPEHGNRKACKSAEFVHVFFYTIFST